MNLEALYRVIKEFSQTPHGNTDYDQDKLHVKGQAEGEFAPLSYLIKKVESLKDAKTLLKAGFVMDSLELFGDDTFADWYEKQFSKKLLRKIAKEVTLFQLPHNKEIFGAIEQVHRSYDILRSQQILLNGKNLPVQMGEWYAKCVFGLEQIKSTSQRGFDFFLDGKRCEIKVHWADHSSPKGVKLRKSLVEMSDYTIIMYIGRNFMIREICLLDSDFVLRKFSTKGHTLFLKDPDVSPYFFSKSNKHMEKVANSGALMKFSNPNFAMKLTEFLGG
tara:strand:- start:2174 stop:2998 length:825 start_codon:yes stop_codon:yes gene_type:complete